MQPIQNLRRFLAVLLILILPAVLTVAYFRNYSPNAKHEHGGGGMEEKPGGINHDSMQGKQGGMDHASMEKKPMSSGEQAQPKQGAMDHGAMQGKQAGGKEITSEQSHEKMQPSDTSGHKHGATSEQTADKTPLPDTLEGVWKAIHENHAGLTSAVKDRKFSDVQSHAKEIRALAKKLVDVTHPDHKPAVESGVNKIVHALDELKSSAETGSESVMKNNFKQFGEALEQLEQQMKKQ